MNLDYDKISMAIVRMFTTEMFYAELMASMRRVEDRTLPAAAGVCIKDQIELHLNPDRLADMSVEELCGIMKHECEHILRDHIPRMKELAPDVYDGKSKDLASNIINSMKHKHLNIAADCAINGGLKDAPSWGVFPANFKLPNGETTEWYAEKLKNNDKMKQMQPGEFDGHELWTESEGDKEVLQEIVKQAVNKAAQKTRAAGKMTSDNELAVSELNKVLVNWKQQLSRFVARSNMTIRESTRKRRNRRYGILVPGDTKVERLHIGVAIDTSGSVSDAALVQFMSEIGGIAKYAKVTVVEADSTVKNSYVYDPKKKYAVKGRGGTAYQPAFDFFNKMKEMDAVIYFGDMDSSDNPRKPKYPVLWAIVGEQKPPASFGSEIRVKVDKE